MSDARDRLGVGLHQLATGAVIEKAASFVNGLLLLRLLDLNDYGTLVLAYSSYAILDLAVGLALGDLVVARCSSAHAAGRRDEAHALLTSYLLWQLAIGSALCIGAVILQPLIVARMPAFGVLYLFGFLAGLTTPMRNLIITILRIDRDFRAVKHVDIVRSVALTAGYATFIHLFGWGLVGGLVAYAIANLLPMLVFAGTILKQFAVAIAHPRPRPVFDLLVTDEGKYQLLRYGATAVHATLRPWLIQVVLGTQAVALFNAAKTVLGIPADLLPLKEALVPLMSREAGRPARLRRLYADSVRFSTAVFGALAVVVVLGAPWVFTSLFPTYHDANALVRVMSLSFLVSGFATPQASLFYALRLQRSYFWTTLISLVFMVVVGVPLMLASGVMGMATAFVLNGVALAIVRQGLLHRACPALRLSAAEWLSFGAPDRKLMRQLLLGR